MGNSCQINLLNDLSSGSSKRKIRVAIIGAGPSGLSALHAFAQAILLDESIATQLELVCFESQPNLGGQWYSSVEGMPNVTGLYSMHGEPDSKNLWTNGPKECLEYADYSFKECFGRSIPSYPLREKIWEYLKGRAEKSEIIKYIRFNSTTRWIQFDNSTSEFIINVENTVDNLTSRHRFDNVIIATGHFTSQVHPHIKGLASFNGPVLHSYHFRDPELYKGKRILVVGSGESAEDICWHCLQNGAFSVTVSTNGRGSLHPMYPEFICVNMDFKPLISIVQENGANFTDGSFMKADAIVLCTGFLFDFPYLDSDLKLSTKNSLYPNGLYKGVVWTKNPSLFYIGMQAQYLTNQLYDAQAWWIRDVILGEFELPTKKEMLSDIALWQADKEMQKTNSTKILFQSRYLNDLWKKTNCPRFNVDAIVQMFEDWELLRKSNIMKSRSKPFKSVIDGTLGMVSNISWSDIKLDVT